jgi:flagellin-like protein
MPERAISPAVGVVLLVAIVVVLVGLVATLALGFEEELVTPSPRTALEVTEYSPSGGDNSGRPYMEIRFQSGEVADGTDVYVRDESGNEVAWEEVWTAGPRVGPGSYAHIDGCGSDGALDEITEGGQEYQVVFKQGGDTLRVRTVTVPTDPTSTGC